MFDIGRQNQGVHDKISLRSVEDAAWPSFRPSKCHNARYRSYQSLAKCRHKRARRTAQWDARQQRPAENCSESFGCAVCWLKVYQQVVGPRQIIESRGLSPSVIERAITRFQVGTLARWAFDCGRRRGQACNVRPGPRILHVVRRSLSGEASAANAEGIFKRTDVYRKIYLWSGRPAFSQRLGLKAA